MPDDPSPIGWLVTDPDGNVVDSGPPLDLEMTTTSTPAEGTGDGRD